MNHLPGQDPNQTPLRPDLEPTPAPWASGPAPDAQSRRARPFIAAFLSLVLVGAGVGIGWGLHQSGPGIGGRASLGAAGGDANRGGQAAGLRGVASQVAPGVADINTFTTGMGRIGSRPVPLGAGTGMVLTPSGEVLTNNHVIQGATSIRVTVQGHPGGLPAAVIGADPTADVALLQIQGVSGLQTVTPGNSSGVRPGQKVLAIGNALGRGGSPTATKGNVSALNRSITVGNDHGGVEHLTGLIQSDAPISPGDSGGALANSSGQVVGMMTAAAAGGPSQRVSHEGYSIPIDAALGIVNQIRTGQASSNIIIGPVGFLGVAVQNLDPSLAAQLGSRVRSGALVVRVVPGAPADGASIRPNSVITAIDGQPIRSAAMLAPALYAHKPGEQISVTWVDRSQQHTASVRLITGPAV